MGDARFEDFGNLKTGIERPAFGGAHDNMTVAVRHLVSLPGATPGLAMVCGRKRTEGKGMWPHEAIKNGTADVSRSEMPVDI